MKRLLYLALLLCCAVACTQKPAPAGEPASEAQDSLVEEIVAEPDTFVFFQTEADVRAYLCKHIYKSVLSLVCVLILVNHNISEKSTGMLGNTTIRFTALPTGNVIEDLNDGILYWEYDK